MPDDIEIPTVHHYDPANRILQLSDVAGAGGSLLETILLEGMFDVSTAAAVGRFLGIVHRRTWGMQRSIRGSRGIDRKNWERFLAMRTRGITADWISPDISVALQNLYTHSLTQHSHAVLMWMDCCPKNILVRQSGKIGVIDFELACAIGDPAYDLGFFIGHYLIHAMIEDVSATALQAIAASIRAYGNAVEGTEFKNGMMARVIKFAAATIFYRVAGASRLTYIKPASAQALLQKAGAILLNSAYAAKTLSPRSRQWTIPRAGISSSNPANSAPEKGSTPRPMST